MEAMGVETQTLTHVEVTGHMQWNPYTFRRNDHM